jgi:hypothetical protein
VDDLPLSFAGRNTAASAVFPVCVLRGRTVQGGDEARSDPVHHRGQAGHDLYERAEGEDNATRSALARRDPIASATPKTPSSGRTITQISRIFPSTSDSSSVVSVIGLPTTLALATKKCAASSPKSWCELDVAERI